MKKEEHSPEEIIEILIQSQVNKSEITDETFELLDSLYAYTSSKNAVFHSSFANSNFISLLINVLQLKSDFTFRAIQLVNDLWYLNDDTDNVSLYDEELIETLLELLETSETDDGRCIILKAFVNCLFTNIDTVYILMQNAFFVENFERFITEDNLSLIVPSLKLLYLMVNNHQEEHFRYLFDRVISLTTNYISVISINSMRCVCSFVTKDTKYYLETKGVPRVKNGRGSVDLPRLFVQGSKGGDEKRPAARGLGSVKRREANYDRTRTRQSPRGAERAAFLHPPADGGDGAGRAGVSRCVGLCLNLHLQPHGAVPFLRGRGGAGQAALPRGGGGIRAV